MNTSSKILIVGMNKIMSHVTHNLFKSIGFSNTHEAADSATALQQLRDGDYDMVIAEDEMEPKTGLQLVAEIRNDDNLKDMPFILVFEEAERSKIMAAEAAGVHSYMVKPFTARLLQEKLEEAFNY